MPVHRRTHMKIKNVPTQGYFPFSEAQVLTIKKGYQQSTKSPLPEMFGLCENAWIPY